MGEGAVLELKQGMGTWDGGLRTFLSFKGKIGKTLAKFQGLGILDSRV